MDIKCTQIYIHTHRHTPLGLSWQRRQSTSRESPCRNGPRLQVHVYVTRSAKTDHLVPTIEIEIAQ